MASIVENILGDKAIQLGNEEFVRKLPWGNSWNFMRVGLYCRLFGTATVPLPAYFQIGVCNGDQQTFASNECAGYAGGLLGTSQTGSFVYDGVNKRYSTTSGGSDYVNSQVKKTGPTATYGLTAGTNTASYLAAATTLSPSIVLCEFTRMSSSSYAAICYYTSAAQFNPPIRPYDYYRCLDDWVYAANFITGGNHFLLSSLPSNMDTLSIFWNHNIPVMEIESIIAVNFY